MTVFFLLLACALPGLAGPMSSATTAVTKTVIDGVDAKPLSSSDGVYSLTGSLGQSAAGMEVSGSVGLNAGFFGVGLVGNGRPATSLSLSILGAGALVRQGNTFFAVPSRSSVTIAFDSLMLAASLAQATTVTMVTDRLAQPVGSTQPFVFSYDSAANTLSIWASTGAWPANSVYQVDLSTRALDADGLPLASSVTLTFSTLADPAQWNVMAPINGGLVKVQISSGTFNQPYFMQFNDKPDISPTLAAPGAVLAANAKIHAPVVSLIEINAYDAQNHKLATAFGSGQAQLLSSYSDAANPGFVDGFGYEARVNKLSIYYLDEAGSYWTRLPDSSVNTANHLVSAPLPHLSVYAAIAPLDLSVADAHVFPSPFRPNGPNAGTGAGQTGTEAGGITFIGLPSQGQLEVYTMRGELVWSASIADNSGKTVWNVRNANGEKVATGVYLYIVRSSQEKIVGKLSVIR